MKFKKILSVVLVAGFILSIPVTNGNLDLQKWDGEQIFASTSDRDQAQEELDDIQDEMDALEDDFSALESQMSAKAQALSDLLADKQLIEDDIKSTQIAIEQAEIDLAAAKEKEEQEYQAMKLRIQYMYENSTQDSVIDAILNADGVVDMLNRVEYVSQVHKSDRELLEEYKAAVAEVEMIAENLEIEMNDLLTLEEVYEHQEAELESALAELEAEADDYEAQLASAKKRADKLADYIEEQNELIAQQVAANNRQESSTEESTQGGESSGTSQDPAFTSDVTGDELVAYALQFVGNPYKYGGNSLTEGCDCSGFVNLIYTHFGFKNVPRQSQAFKTYGSAVSFENIKAGDIVVYPGHVAIYIGNGCIVEAQSSKAGITSNRSVTCNTITAIRRVL